MQDTRAHSAVVGAEGHLIDSNILNAIFDKVIERGGAFEVLTFAIGRTNDEFSRISLKVSAPTAAGRPILWVSSPSRRRARSATARGVISASRASSASTRA